MNTDRIEWPRAEDDLSAAAGYAQIGPVLLWSEVLKDAAIADATRTVTTGPVRVSARPEKDLA